MLAIRKPGWALLLLFMFAQLVFIVAAHWQWRRAVDKDHRDREFAAALADPGDSRALDFAQVDAFTGDFRPARLHGTLLLDRIYLHDNRIVDGQYGVDVYAPLVMAGGHVLVNLGWIQADRSRRIAPAIPALDADFDASGLLAPAPAIGLLAGHEPAPTRGRVALRLNIDSAMIARETGLQPMAAHVFWPAPAADSPFRRDWRPGGIAADRHRGYALQWASFAAASLILFLIFHIRRKDLAP